MKEHPMKIEIDPVRAEIRALLTAPHVLIPEYSVDPMVLRRVGRILAQSKACAFDSPFGANWPTPK
jgi:hypothetical protein